VFPFFSCPFGRLALPFFLVSELTEQLVCGVDCLRYLDCAAFVGMVLSDQFNPRDAEGLSVEWRFGHDAEDLRCELQVFAAAR
jgi:hypothetical protein